MLDIQQFKTEVIVPALSALAQWKPDETQDMASPAATKLLLGTALQESNLTYLRQLGGGPGLGLFQIEPATHDDVWTNYIAFRTGLESIVESFSAGQEHGAEQLAWNLGYSAMIARLIYWRAPAPMPQAEDIDGLGQYWKTYYNTAGGAGTAEQWSANYRRSVLNAT